MKKLIFSTLLLSVVFSGFAQRKSAIGFSGNLTDFKVIPEIDRTSFKDVWKNDSWRKPGKMIPNFSVYYWQGITNRIDASLRYNGGFDPAFATTQPKLKKYFNELELNVHARAFKEKAIINPFLTAGIAAGSYWKGSLQPYAPLGVGIQINLANQSFIFLQANKRYSFDKDKMPNNMFYSLGVAQSLKKEKKEEPKPLPPAPVAVDNDTDKDGVLNANDKCPDVAGLAKYDGCPVPDADRDGINDEEDKCPSVAGLAKYDGCPIPDTDGDGFNDELDECVSVAGVAKYKGCPVPDKDGDGVNDEEDRCPAVAGTAANFGCPEIKKEIVERIKKAAGSIYFATGSAKLLAKSNTSLNSVVKTLKENPELKVHIDGHTDNTGTAVKNQILSTNRANAVKTYLISKGIDAARLTSEGFGQDKPVADNKTAAGRTKNRRVELNLTNY